MRFTQRKVYVWLLPIIVVGSYLIYSAAIQYSSLPRSFSTIGEAIDFAYHLKSPCGRWLECSGTSDQLGERICVLQVEYLFRDKYRVFVIAGKNGDFRVIDDFVSATIFHTAELKAGKLKYLDYYRNVVLERNAQPRA